MKSSHRLSIANKLLWLTTDVVVMISIDDFKVSNGATKVWPYSHQSGIRIHQQNKKKPSKNFHYLKASKALHLYCWGKLGTK